MVRTRQSLAKYLDRLLSEGRTVFTATEAEKDLGLRHRPFLDAAERLQRSRKLLAPRQGFYVVVPPQYAGWGADGRACAAQSANGGSLRLPR